LQEAAVERERFQAQLEMLVQELEQKQVTFNFVSSVRPKPILRSLRF
jgi:hypothetical protein